jgi:gliding motility-associated-like protein
MQQNSILLNKKAVVAVFVFMLFPYTSLKANPNVFSGNMSVAPGSTQTYTLSWGDPIAYHGANQVAWSVSNGTILSSSRDEITVEWNTLPSWQNGMGSITAFEEFGGNEASCSVSLINFIEGTIEECSGILGPPAISINFGAGANPGPQLPSGATTYLYQQNCSITPGKYTVTNNTMGCNGSWLNLTEDHTPNDVNGYMLLVDGDANSNDVYATVVTGLTDAFRYEFSAYVVNLSANPPFELPKLEFQVYGVNGDLWGSSGTLDIPYDPLNPWKRISFMFNIPAGQTSAYVVFKNTNSNPSGNDFVVDDLAFAPCYPPILASFSASSLVGKAYTCNSGNVNLFYRWPTPTIPFSNPSFQWQRLLPNNAGTDIWMNIPGATSQSYSHNESVAGIYKYRILAQETPNNGQLLISNEITYFVQKMVVNPKTYNVINCTSGPFTLIPSYNLQFSDPNGPTYTYSYNWSPGLFLSSTTTEQPVITLPALPPPPPINAPNPAPPIIRNYNLTVSNNNFSGCQATAVQSIAQFNPRKVAIPNAFTPNGDGSNDLFRPKNIEDYPGSKFWIYNRWGNLVFYSEGPSLINFSWNGQHGGQPAEQGVYTWQLLINGVGCANNILNSAGSYISNNPFGNVTLIR